MPRSRSKPSRTGPLAPTAHVDVVIDRALERRWDQAMKRVSNARREGAGAFDELWETVAEIVEHDPPLYLAGGFATARAFLTKHLGESERTARRLMRVAKYASPQEEVRYGVSKLDAALAYVEAKAGGAARGRLPVDFANLRIPIEGDKERKTVSFAEATVQQVAVATRRLLRHGGEHTNRSPLERAVAAGLRAGGLAQISVRVVGGRLALGNIAPGDLAALGKALRGVRLPANVGRPSGDVGRGRARSKP